MRRIGFPTRERNSSHASSSSGPAHRQTTSFRDKDEYRVVRWVFDIALTHLSSEQALAKYSGFHCRGCLLLEISELAGKRRQGCSTSSIARSHSLPFLLCEKRRSQRPNVRPASRNGRSTDHGRSARTPRGQTGHDRTN